MKILFLTSFYPPNNIIASVRSSSLCKYLAKTNEIYVLTYATDSQCKTYDPDYASPPDVNVFHYSAHASKLFVKLNSGRKFSPAWRNNTLLVFAKRLWHFLKMARLFLASAPHALRVTRNINPDVIIASYGPHYMIWNGLLAKALARSSKLVIDIRDPIANTALANKFIVFDAMLQDLYVRCADGIVGVSPWIVSGIRSRGVPTCVITNGYDRDWKKAVGDTRQTTVDESKLNILLMGTIYKMSNPTALLNELKRAIENKKLRPDDIVLHYAGGDYEKLKTYLETEGLLGIAKNHGYLTKDEIYYLEKHTDVLVLLTWNTVNDQDVYTGKLFEYLLFAKPILALVEGDTPGSGVKKIIEKTNAGICFEYCCDSPQIISNFLLGVKAKTRLLNVVSREIEEFSYHNLAKKYFEFIKDL